MPFNTQGKTNLKYILIVVISAVIVSGGILIYSINFARKDFLGNQPEIENLKNNGNKLEKNAKPLYYYFQSYDPDLFTLADLNPDISLEDKISAKLEGSFSVLGEFSEEGKFLVCENKDWPCSNKLSVLNLETGELKDFLIVEEKKGFASAVFSQDKKLLAFSVHSENFGNTAGEIWIYDVAAREKKKVFEKNRLMIYSRLKVLGWNKENNKLIIQEAGGDGGAVWGKVYLVDIQDNGEINGIKNNHINNNYKEIEIKAEEKDYFLQGKLSPDGDNWIYLFCKYPTLEDFEYTSCEEGAEIMIYNFKELSSFSLYKNLAHRNNIYRQKLRIINSAVWLNSEDVIFSTPE